MPRCIESHFSPGHSLCNPTGAAAHPGGLLPRGTGPSGGEDCCPACVRGLRAFLAAADRGQTRPGAPGGTVE